MIARRAGVDKYMDLHDQLYLRINAAQPFLLDIWQPRGIAVVIGYSQVAAREVHLQRCRVDGVPVIRRRGGGGAVVLMPGVLCMTAAFSSTRSESPYFFFNLINQFLVDTLAVHYGITGLTLQGISDVAVAGRKILGCSMFKSRQLFFYQGSLLVNPNLSLIDRLLKHPSQEPDYRQGREHGAFVTSLWQQGYRIETDELGMHLQRAAAALRPLVLQASNDPGRTF